MLGSMSDAEDATQETLIRAWRALERFEGRSTLSTWLARIATRVCLDQFGKRQRSLPPILRAPGGLDDDFDMRPGDVWIEPSAEAWAPVAASPGDVLAARESVSLAWAAALQQLTANQRACLVLMDVVGLSANEAAQTLETSTASVNSALQRARRALVDVAARDTSAAPKDAANREAVERFADAFSRYDLDAIAAMLCAEATMCMPPLALWLRGAGNIVAWMGGRGAGCRGSRIVQTAANGRAAWAQYRPAEQGGYTAWAIVVPVAHDGVVDELHFFLDAAALFPRFGLPLSLPA